MKKIFFVLLLSLLTIFYMSFIPKKSDDFITTKDKTVIYYNGNKKKIYGTEEVEYYCLVDSDKNSYDYRVLLKNEYSLALIYWFDLYMVVGYDNFSHETMKYTIDKNEFNYIKLECLNNIVEFGESSYWGLYSIFSNFLDYYSKYKSVSTYSFDSVTPYELAKTTSTDENLDGYEVERFPLATIKGDDDIVKIVPKDWFFQNGIKEYMGKEYFIYMKTNFFDVENFSVYISQVFIIDIDFGEPSYTMNDYLSNNDLETESHTSSVIIDNVINENYIGITNNNDIFQNRYNIDDSQYQVVVHIDNFESLSYARANPIYLQLDNFMYAIEGDETLPKECALQMISYVVENEDFIPYINDPCKGARIAIFSFLKDIILEFVPTEASLLMTIGKNIWRILSDVFNNPNVDKNGTGSIDSSAATRPTRYTISESEADSSQKIYNRVGIVDIPSYIDKFIENNTDRHSYSFEIRYFDNAFSSLANSHTVNFTFAFDLIDLNRNKINDEQYIYARSEGNVIYADHEEKKHSVDDKTFDFSKSDSHKLTILEEATKDETKIFNVPNGIKLIIANYKGQIVARTDSKYGNLNKLIVRYKIGEVYYFSAEKVNNSVGIVNLSEASSQTIQKNATINNYFLNEIKVFDYVSYDGIYSITTSSREDTHVFIYNEYGRLISQDDDSNADWSEDSPDLNANLQLQLIANRKYYIFVLVKNIYYNNSIDINVELLRR